MRTLACDPSIELLGINISAFIDNEQIADTLPIMQKYGLDNIEPMAWYECHRLLDALNELTKETNFSNNFVAMGMKIGQIQPLPDGVDFSGILQSWDEVYHSLHRNGDIGHLKCDQLNDHHYVITSTDLYPDDFDYGIVYGYAKRLLPTGSKFKVYYDKEHTARDRGDSNCTMIHVEWDN